MAESNNHDKKCPLCFPVINVMDGKQYVSWRVAGFQISTTVDRALDFIQHVNSGLLKEAFGLDLTDLTRHVEEAVKEEQTASPAKESLPN